MRPAARRAARVHATIRALLPVVAFGTACAGTPDTNPDLLGVDARGGQCQCAFDGSAACSPEGAFGLTCGGPCIPDQTGKVCNPGTPSSPLSDGASIDYCCLHVDLPTGCLPATTLDCGFEGYGFLCAPGSASPVTTVPNLACYVSNAQEGATNTEYCCEPVPPGCAAASAANCPFESVAFSCSGGVSPEAPGIACQAPTPDSSGNDAYCCVSWALNDGCTPSAQVTSGCATAGAYGFRCDYTSANGPPSPPLLSCTTGALDANGYQYDFCCTM